MISRHQASKRTYIQALCRAISEDTSRSRTLLDPAVMVTRLNRMRVGWANYFCLGRVWAAYRIVDTHACLRSVSGWGGSSRCRGPGGHATRNPTCAASG